MPDNPSRPTNGNDPSATQGEPKAPQPDLKQQEARPSEAEVAHAPNEAGSVRDPRLQTPQARDPRAGENRG